MLLRSIDGEEGGARIRYGSTPRGQYSTVLTDLASLDRYVCHAIDEDNEEVFIWAKYRRRMDSTPSEKPTQDDRGYIGRVYGQLTILQTMGWTNRHRTALCLCSCGGTKIARIASLRSGFVISCGCRRGKNTELPIEPGSKYGNLTVISKVDRPVEQKKKEGYYLVKCVCGNEHIRGRENIVTPKNPDCGCRGLGLLRDQRFGKLVILGESKIEGRQRLVLTRCDCGTESYARLGSLQSGKKKSCGCMKSGPRASHRQDPELTPRILNGAPVQ